jgi:hypothetical protein
MSNAVLHQPRGDIVKGGRVLWELPQSNELMSTPHQPCNTNGDFHHGPIERRKYRWRVFNASISYPPLALTGRARQCYTHIRAI